MTESGAASRDDSGDGPGHARLAESLDRASKPFLIGLTGPIGCGKSEVARMLGELGGTVIDADALAREVTASGEPALAAIRGRFGPSVFGSDGSLDRSELGRLVFSDPAALADLEAITHPHVRRRVLDLLDRAAAAGDPFVVVEAIRLVEGGLAASCDEVWLVECSPGEQQQRLIDRGMTADDIAGRVAAQGSLVDRAAPLATRRITTSGSLEDTRGRVEEALADALAPVMLED